MARKKKGAWRKGAEQGKGKKATRKIGAYIAAELTNRETERNYWKSWNDTRRDRQTRGVKKDREVGMARAQMPSGHQRAVTKREREKVKEGDVPREAMATEV